VTDALAEEKAALRDRMRALRRSVPPGERLRLADSVEARLFDLPVIGGARSVLVFYSFGSEIPTAGILQRLLDEGHRVLLPCLDDAGMAAAELRPGDSLVATAYGPREPSTRVAVHPEMVDVVLAPGLAFDRRGHRLGYGGGHYDRYLRQLRPDAEGVGIAFHIQVIDAVPHGEGDQRLDLVVTDRETIRTGRRDPAATSSERESETSP